MGQIKSRFDEGRIDGFKDTCKMVERRWLRKQSVKSTLREYLESVHAHNVVFGLKP